MSNSLRRSGNQFQNIFSFISLGETYIFDHISQLAKIASSFIQLVFSTQDPITISVFFNITVLPFSLLVANFVLT